jgi:nucleotide-binding universal stress UspA family protein
MIKAILAPATGSNTDAAVFSAALAVAKKFAAHIDLLHVRVDAAAMAATMAADGGGAVMVSGLVERIDEEAEQREDRAKASFQSFCDRERLGIADAPAGQTGPTAQWLRQVGDEPYWIAEHGRSADLLVIGRAGDSEGVSVETIEAALLGSGRPVLIPAAGPLVALPETVVIAWKAAPEAARAVTAAMPLIATAKRVLIVTVAEEMGLSDQEGARLMASLRWHGLDVSTRHLQPGISGAAGTLLDAARDEAALVVMGAYGRSRLREWVFGGFTHHVLRGAEVPVLMMH